MTIRQSIVESDLDLLDLEGEAFDSLVEKLVDKQLERMTHGDSSKDGTKKSKIKKILDATIKRMFEKKGEGNNIIDLKVSDIILDLKLKQSDRVMINEALEDICDDNRWKGVERIGHTLLIHRDPVDEKTVVLRKERRFRNKQEARARYSRKAKAVQPDVMEELEMDRPQDLQGGLYGREAGDGGLWRAERAAEASVLDSFPAAPPEEKFLLEGQEGLVEGPVEAEAVREFPEEDRAGGESKGKAKTGAKGKGKSKGRTKSKAKAEEDQGGE